jgi:hypothetical protein
MLFIANDGELPHVLSDARPNDLAGMWKEVNRVVFEGRGTLETPQEGLNGGEFTGMSILYNSAHASLSTMATSVGIGTSPGALADVAKKHLQHCEEFCIYLNYMEGIFRAGKAKSSVLTGVRNIHKPLVHSQSTKS